MKSGLPILFLTASLLHAETLDELLKQTAQSNPAIAAARQQWEAARERTLVAGALPDPRLSYGFYLEEIETKTGPQQQKGGISQRFPMFGKRGLSESAAAHSAEATYARYRAVRADTLFQFKKVWIERVYLARAINTARARRNLFQTLEKTAERAVENGGDARDLLDLRITLTQIEDSLRTLEAQQTPLESRLNALLNRAEQTPLPPPTSLPRTEKLNEQQIQSAFRADSPAIEEQRAMVARRQAQQTLTKRNWMPDITLGADWIQTGDGGNDPLIAGLSINLPLWHTKNRAERLSAGFEYAAQTSQLQNQINRAEVLLAESLSERNDADRRETFYAAELIPPAEQHFELTRTAYENGEADLRELTASEERLLKLRLMLERSRADRTIADAEIEKILGGAEVPPANLTGEEK